MFIPTKFNKIKINNNSNILLLALRSIGARNSDKLFIPIYFYFPNDTNISIFNNIIFEIYKSVNNEEYTFLRSLNISELIISTENNSFSNLNMCFPHYYTEQDKNKIYIQYEYTTGLFWDNSVSYKFKVYDINNQNNFIQGYYQT